MTIANVRGRVRAVSVMVMTLLIAVAMPIHMRTDAAQAIPVPVHRTVDGLAVAEAMRAAGTGGVDVSEPLRTPIAFSMIGFEHPVGGEVEFRTSEDGSDWTEWQEAHPISHDEAPDGPLADPESIISVPIWVHTASWVQVRSDEVSLADVRLHLIDTLGHSTNEVRYVPAEDDGVTALALGTPAQAVPKPKIISRAAWGADETIRKDTPSYAINAQLGILHHTAGSNEYTQAEAPAVVRGIYYYHVKANGWSDIGYNLLVDRFGNVYEGRAGGVERAVIGAHARGFNAESFGVSIMGNFQTAEPSQAAMYSVARVFAWKFGVHGIDPAEKVTIVSEGSPKFKDGTAVTLDPLSTHRDVGLTSCPGDRLYAKLGTIRNWTKGLYTFDFKDISGLSHAPAIREIAQKGITVGCKDGRYYCPADDVTRAQMATFLLRAMRTENARWGQDFSDVPLTHTHAADINGINDAGLTEGCGDGSTFCPNRSVTRAEMATFLVRAIPGLEPDPDGNRFVDVAANSSHRAAINAIYDAGITVGCGDKTTFCPDDPVTRAEMATFISRSLQHGIRDENWASPSPEDASSDGASGSGSESGA